MAPTPRTTSWRQRRLTRREEEASVRLLLIVPALLVALLAPLSWCSPPGTVTDTAAPAAPAAPATITEAVERPLAGVAGAIPG